MEDKEGGRGVRKQPQCKGILLGQSRAHRGVFSWENSQVVHECLARPGTMPLNVHIIRSMFVSVRRSPSPQRM